MDTPRTNTLAAHLAALPLIAILRGVRPDEVTAIAGALADEGFGIIEVPLNSPDPYRSIARLADALGGRCLVGAGTVRRTVEVDHVAANGGRLIVMPHTDPVIIRHAKERGLEVVPGFATVSEAIAATQAGADALKLFPAEGCPPQVLKAMMAIIGDGLPVLPVGGIAPETMAGYRAVGARGFGLGGNLYKPGDGAGAVAQRAHAFVAAWRGSSSV